MKRLLWKYEDAYTYHPGLTDRLVRIGPWCSICPSHVIRSLVHAEPCTLVRSVSVRGCLRLKFLCFKCGFKRHINDFKGRYLFLFLWKLCWQMGVNVFRWSNLPSVRQIITTSISLILPHPPVEPNRVKRNIFESGLTLIFYILNIN